MATAGAKPTAASVADLVALSRRLGHPIYWAGPEPDARLELTRAQNGNVYVRYLTGNAPIGEGAAKFLSVGTYPFDNAYAALQALAERHGEQAVRVANGGIAVPASGSPTSVYVAYPDQNLEIEVYDPSPARALETVTSGALGPIG